MSRFSKGNIFDSVQDLLAAEKNLAPHTKRAQRWFRKTIRTIFSVVNIDVNEDIIQDPSRSMGKRSPTWIGRMYCFVYDPKHKQTLPYYDKFPLIFIIEHYKDGFLGINLHYLPIRLRIKLFDELMKLNSDTRWDARTRLRLSYQLLNNARRFRWFKPCIKRYLISHIRSRIVEIPSQDWQIALFLPVENFKKASKETVWNDSRRKIK